MKYISTRGDKEQKSFTDILLSGLAPDGGLYLPQSFPLLDMSELRGKSYIETANKVISPYLDDEFSDIDFEKILNDTYGIKAGIFGHKSISPMVQIDDNIWIMELFHGPTIAFKDIALQLLGRFFDFILKKHNQKITIVGATSGDTGSAAIEACKNCENIEIFILHPKGRVSDVQRKQMTSVNSPNVHNIALEGNFDDCQNLVKAMFNDKDFKASQNLSAINSINWARIMAQSVYYFYAASALGICNRRKVNFAVPTGNFGNIFAAYVARNMGLPINKLIIGSNKNDILTRFFETGEMKKEIVEPSISPSMDIGISSNFERYLYLLLNKDSEKLNNLMQDFQDKGSFTLEKDLMVKAKSEFESYRCNDDDTKNIIEKCYKETGYLIDPHTAVGLNAAIKANDDKTIPMVVLACAHPAKFPVAVKEASGKYPDLPEKLGDLFEREEYFDILPNDLNKVQNFIKEKTK